MVGDGRIEVRTPYLHQRYTLISTSVAVYSTCVQGLSTNLGVAQTVNETAYKF